jgi:hypothetical protein
MKISANSLFSLLMQFTGQVESYRTFLFARRHQKETMRLPASSPAAGTGDHLSSAAGVPPPEEREVRV